MEFNSVINLGWRCTPAFQIKRKGLRLQSFPIDWLISASFDSIIKLFKQDFEGFLLHFVDHTEKYAKVKEESSRVVIENLQYPGIFFRHTDVRREEEREVMKRRIIRFRSLLRSGYRILFIRLLKNRTSPFTKEGDSIKTNKILEQSKNFEDVLLKNYTCTNYKLLFLIETFTNQKLHWEHKEKNIEIVKTDKWDGRGIFTKGNRPEIEKKWNNLFSQYSFDIKEV